MAVTTCKRPIMKSLVITPPTHTHTHTHTYTLQTWRGPLIHFCSLQGHFYMSCCYQGHLITMLLPKTGRKFLLLLDCQVLAFWQTLSIIIARQCQNFSKTAVIYANVVLQVTHCTHCLTSEKCLLTKKQNTNHHHWVAGWLSAQLGMTFLCGGMMEKRLNEPTYCRA